MTIAQPMLPLWDDEPVIAAAPPAAHTTRILARSSDRVAWLRARSRGITATDVAKLATERSVRAVVDDKWHGSRFSGNVFTDHGRRREPEIAAWVQENFGIAPSDALFHAESSRVHLATPDGIAATSARLELAEIKTTSSPWRSIPRGYLRQVWWQQYVLGAERTLLVWEQHREFVPVDAEPQHRWIDRDDNEIHMLVRLADQVLAALDTRGREVSVYRGY